MPMLWRQAAKMWLAKGFTHTAAADRLEKKFGPGKGFSRNRIGTLATTECEPCPPEVAEFIAQWEVLDATKWSHYQRELENAKPEDSAPPPSSPSQSPPPLEVARDAASIVANLVRDWLDTAASTFASSATALLSDLGARLDSAHGKLDGAHGKLDGAHGKLDSAHGKLDGAHGKLDGAHGKLDSAHGKLDGAHGKLDSAGSTLDRHGTQLGTLQATVKDTHASVESLAAKVDSSEQQRRRDKWHSLAAIFGTGVGAVLLIGLMLQGQRVPSTAPAAPVQCITVNQGQGAADVAGRMLPGGAPAGFDLRTFLGAIASGEMGKKAPEELWIPDQPLPGQKLPPCEARLGEAEIKGGCWGNMTAAVKPPCGLLFRYGDGCYRPVAADPKKSVGLVPEQPHPEQPPAQR